jgi:hypothetical protein
MVARASTTTAMGQQTRAIRGLEPHAARVFPHHVMAALRSARAARSFVSKRASVRQKYATASTMTATLSSTKASCARIAHSATMATGRICSADADSRHGMPHGTHARHWGTIDWSVLATPQRTNGFAPPRSARTSPRAIIPACGVSTMSVTTEEQGRPGMNVTTERTVSIAARVALHRISGSDSRTRRRRVRSDGLRAQRPPIPTGHRANRMILAVRIARSCARLVDSGTMKSAAIPESSGRGFVSPSERFPANSGRRDPSCVH